MLLTELVDSDKSASRNSVICRAEAEVIATYMQIAVQPGHQRSRDVFLSLRCKADAPTTAVKTQGKHPCGV